MAERTGRAGKDADVPNVGTADARTPMPSVGKRPEAEVSLLLTHALVVRSLPVVRDASSDRRQIRQQSVKSAHFQFIIAVPPHDTRRALRRRSIAEGPTGNLASYGWSTRPKW